MRAAQVRFSDVDHDPSPLEGTRARKEQS